LDKPYLLGNQIEDIIRQKSEKAADKLDKFLTERSADYIRARDFSIEVRVD